MTKTRTTLAAAAAALLAAGCGGSSKSHVAGAQKTLQGQLVGAGSTLVAPLVAAWQSSYHPAKQVAITYSAIGSGGGIQQLTSRTIDFAGSDAPLTADQKSACKDCVMVPWALAATTLAYHVTGLAKPLRLTGNVVADIYLGAITNWNDPRIVKLNPGVKLPAEGIRPVYRSDPSGDTFAFTDFLSHASPAWKTKAGGATTSVQWPTGVGAKGNAGVAAAIEQTPGAIGYVAVAQARQSRLSTALLRNRAGTYEAATPATIAAAAATARFRADNSVSIVDPPASAAKAYPLSTFTYAIVPRGSAKLPALKAFLRFAVTDGQRYAKRLFFAQLPQSVVAKDRRIVAGL